MACKSDDPIHVSTNEVVFWYYKSNVDIWPNTAISSSSSSEWTKYRDIEMDIIEEAYQKGKPYVLLDRYRIDLEKFIQIRLDNDSKQRPLKREIGSNRQECLRQQRFSLPLTATPEATLSSSYGTHDSGCPFLRAWLNSPAGKRAWLHVPSCIEACARGIVQEALHHESNSNAIAAFMAEKIRQCVGRPRREVSKLCIYFYTKDTFLYDALNKALREVDLSKLETLGPLGYLIGDYSRQCKEFVGTVYRGMELKYADIEMYKKAIGMWKSWPAYTSTSKDREMAEMFGNTLFVIEVTDRKLSAPRTFDVCSISSFPSEQEVLLPAGISFQIVDVNQTLKQKYVINIRV